MSCEEGFDLADRNSLPGLAAKASQRDLLKWLGQPIRHAEIAFRRAVPGRRLLRECLDHNDSQ